MKIKTNGALITGAMLLAPAAWSQDTVTVTAQSFGGIHVMNRIELDSKTVVQAPYSADQTTTTTQHLADGNRIVNTSTVKVYRDRLGRTRVEETVHAVDDSNKPQSNTIVNITDTVANVHYTLHPESRTAERTETSGIPPIGKEPAFFFKRNAEEQASVRGVLPSILGVAATGPLADTISIQSKAGSREIKTDDLGRQVMEGLQVEGKRTTVTIPAGAIGNDLPISIVDERWYSPELQMPVMTKHSDPRMGETVFSVVNVSRADPDPALFQLPGDYQVTSSKNLMFRTTKSLSKP